MFTGSENKFWIFENAALFTHFSDIFQRENQRFPVPFESANWSIRSIIQQFSLTVNSTKTIVFLVLRMRCQMGKRFVFVAYWCFPVAEDCFHRDRAFSSIFPRTGKCVENTWKLRVVQRSRVGQRKEMRCFLAFFSCWRWENALLSAIHRIQLFPRIFKYLPFDYRAKKGIYSYIYRCFTPLTTWISLDMFNINICFGEALFSLMKKKTKKNNNNNKQIMACKPLNAVVCCFKVSFTIKWKKSCQTNCQQLYSRIFVWKI